MAGRLYQSLSSLPFQSHINWFVILPLVALWAILAGILIWRKRKTVEDRQRVGIEAAPAYARAMEDVR
jgi:hypothetical protein